MTATHPLTWKQIAVDGHIVAERIGVYSLDDPEYPAAILLDESLVAALTHEEALNVADALLNASSVLGPVAVADESPAA